MFKKAVLAVVFLTVPGSSFILLGYYLYKRSKDNVKES